MKLLPILILANTLVALGWVNSSIYNQEKILDDGRSVILEIGPRDPRSLMQGDYMRLRYVFFDDVVPHIPGNLPTRGLAVLQLDDRGVARIVKVDGVTRDEKLAENEALIRYRKTRWGFRVAPESYFFEEGKAERLEAARFAELRISERGEAVLAQLLDEDLKPIED